MKPSRLQIILLCLASAYVHFASFGISVSLGIVFLELLDKYDGTVSETTWLPSLYSGVSFLVGPLSGAIARRYGARRAGIAGCIIMTCGMLSSAFIYSLPALYLTFGVIGGFGSSIMHLCAHVIIMHHFSKWRSRMIGITTGGIGVASMTLPLLTKATIDFYGLHGTFCILAGFAFQGVAGAALFIPPEEPKQPLQDNHSTQTLSEITKQQANDYANLPENTTPKPGFDRVKLVAKLKSSFAFINLPFGLFCSSWAFVLGGVFIPYLYLPSLALSFGLSKQEAAYIASAQGGGYIFGRVCLTGLADIKRLKTIYLHILLMFLLGVFSLLLVFVSTFAGLVTSSILNGIAYAGAAGIFPVIIADLVGLEHLEMAYGMFTLSVSVTTVVGQPAAGAIIDSTGTFTSAFYYCSSLAFVATVLAAIIPCVQYFQTKNQKSNSSKAMAEENTAVGLYKISREELCTRF